MINGNLRHERTQRQPFVNVNFVILCINTIFSIVFGFYIPTTWTTRLDRLICVHCFVLHSFHFISESMCWHKLAFLFFVSLLFMWQFEITVWRPDDGCDALIYKKKTRSNIRHATTSKRDGKTHLISDLCYFFSRFMCVVVAFRVVHCAHFGCERTYQTLETYNEFGEKVYRVRGWNESHIYIRCLLLRSAIKFRTFYKFMCVDCQLCGCCCADVVRSKNNEHSKWQISETKIQRSRDGFVARLWHETIRSQKKRRTE